MTACLTITPGGRLHLAEAPDGGELLPADIQRHLHAAFSQSSADGLILLASRELAIELPAECVYWRGLARQFFQAVCQLPEESAAWQSVPPPSDEKLAELVAAAPPMRGLEYLNSGLLRRLWTELADRVAAAAKDEPGGPAAWLQRINPLWHLVGRVTFHLAENKRDQARPFAFLATYSHRQTQRSKPAHLPLGEALKMYAGAGDRAHLDSLLEPVRRAAASSEVVRQLLESRALFAPQAWSIAQAYEFLRQTPQMEEAGVVVRVPNWWSSRQPPRPQVKVQLGEQPVSQLGFDSLLDFRVNVALDGEDLTDEEREQLLRNDDGLMLLRGKWVEVNRQQLQEALDHWKLLQQEHAGGIDFIQGMRMLAGVPLDAADEVDGRAATWSLVTAGAGLRQLLEQIRQPDRASDCQPGRDLQATLRPYQVQGVRWLWLLSRLGLGACLADDMGLGKTIQVIDLLLQYKRVERDAAAPSLLIVPTTLLGNWRQELARFAPQLQVFFAHRSETAADELAEVAKKPQSLAGFDLVITTYGLARRETWLAERQWSLVILDEAQAIKNATSAQTRSIKKLPARGRVVMTGTPVENHLGDLWSLFDFCSPGLLGSAAQFKKYVKQLNERQDSAAFAGLRRLVRPYILRRMKTDPQIIPDLPAKTEMRADCGLTKKQAALYERAVNELAERLDQDDAEGIARRGLVLASLMQLKQICNHPAQYLRSGKFAPADSGKFERLRALCQPIAERQEKALIFTQFQSLAEPLAEFLASVFGRGGLVLHGGTPAKRRPELVRQFQDEAGPPFFVISLKAGGSGLNLTAASHVIHFDRWWNPAVENQATDRAFRIGQKRNVLVHKFVCRGTVEERIDAMLASKQSIADKLLNQESEVQLTELSNDELLKFVSLDIGRATAEE